jgi:hypothetical protein
VRGRRRPWSACRRRAPARPRRRLEQLLEGDAGVPLDPEPAGGLDRGGQHLVVGVGCAAAPASAMIASRSPSSQARAPRRTASRASGSRRLDRRRPERAVGRDGEPGGDGPAVLVREQRQRALGQRRVEHRRVLADGEVGGRGHDPGVAVGGRADPTARATSAMCTATSTGLSASPSQLAATASSMSRVLALSTVTHGSSRRSTHGASTPGTGPAGRGRRHRRGRRRPAGR